MNGTHINLPWDVLAPAHSPKLLCVTLAQINDGCLALIQSNLAVVPVATPIGLRLASEKFRSHPPLLINGLIKVVETLRPPMLSFRFLSFNANTYLVHFLGNSWITAVAFALCFRQGALKSVTEFDHYVSHTCEILASFQSLKHLQLTISGAPRIMLASIVERFATACARLL